MLDFSLFPHPSLGVSLTLCLALMIGLILRLWLHARQVRHVLAHRHAVPAAFARHVELQAHQKAADYTVARSRLAVWEMVWGAAVLMGWTLLGGLNALNQFLLQWMNNGLGQQVLLLALFGLVSGLLDVPLAWYQTFVLEQRFGFNKMGLKLWLADGLKSGALGLVLGLPIATLILWLMASAGGLWWFWAWGAWVAFSLFLMWIYPTWIAPWFNRFTPLQDERVRDRVTALLQRCGFSAKGLFVMDGSQRSAHANAYFTGFGASKRVVFFDTLLAKLTPEELDAVLAHELGHFKHKHIAKRLLTLFASSLLGFALLGWLADQSWFFTGLGVMPNLGGANEALALLLFVLTAPVFGLFIQPVFSQLSRKHEFEADAYAGDQTHPADLASALLKLFEDNASTLTPDPLFAAFYHSHPPAAQRLSRLLRGAGDTAPSSGQPLAPV